MRSQPIPPAAAGEAVTEYDPHIGYRYVANLRVPVSHPRGRYTVQTNSLGLRNSREYGRTPPLGSRRILLIGDSITAGDGVDNHERFSDRLEAAGGPLEVVNCGLPGSGTDQQLLVLERVKELLEYDVLLVCPLVENIRRNLVRFRLAVEPRTGDTVAVPKPYFSLEAERLVLRNVPVPQQKLPLAEVPKEALPHVDFGGQRASTKLRSFVNEHARPVKSWLIQVSQFQPHPEYDDPSSMGWRLMKRILERMIAANAGKPTVIAPLPYYIHIEHPATANYMPRFRELAGPGVHVLDLLPSFHQLSGVDRLRCRYRDDPHYTPFAHELVAKAMAEQLMERKLLPDHT
jgi:hypothetical protein